MNRTLLRRLAVLALLSAVGVNVLLPAVILIAAGGRVTPLEIRRSTGWAETRGFLRFNQGADGLMQPAWTRLHSDDPLPFYQGLFFRDKAKFVYPPTALLLFYPLVPFVGSVDSPELFSAFAAVFRVVSWVAVAIIVVVSVRLFERALSDGPAPTIASRLALYGLLAVLSLGFYPLMKAYSLGQVQTVIGACLAGALWCWLTGRKALAGVLVGLACLLKPHYVLLLAWGALRKEWKFTVSLAAVAALGAAVSIALFGLDTNIDYLRVLSFVSARGEVYYANQSVNGILNRWLSTGRPIPWSTTYPEYHLGVHAGTLAAGALFLASAALLPMFRKGARSGVLDLFLFMLACTMASPVAWQHHYLILPCGYALLAGALLRADAPPGARRTALVLLAVSYLLTANFLRDEVRLLDAPWGLDLIASHIFFGALLAYGLLCYVLWTRGRSSEANKGARPL